MFRPKFLRVHHHTSKRMPGKLFPRMVAILLLFANMVILVLFLLLSTSGTRDRQFPCNELEGFVAEKYPFCNRTLLDAERVADLVSRLTRAEKIGLLVNKASAVPRLGILSSEWWNEGLHGSPGVMFDGPILAATSFPQPILTAASFNATLWNEIGRVVSTEARALHNSEQAGLTYWTPNINLFRDPRWGRGQDTPGEDPLLTSVYAEYFVRGLQEDAQYDGDSTKHGPARLKVSAICNHFTAYDLVQLERMEADGSYNAKVSQQDLDDSFNGPFQACIQNGRASGIMCSYNDINGVRSCADADLLTTLATGTWGYDEYIMPDCDVVGNIYANHFYATPEGSVAETLKAGMDINCGNTLSGFTEDALELNLIAEDDIDTALARSFAVQFRLGMFDGDPLGKEFGWLGTSDVCTEEHQQLALEAALQGIVLLKNSDDILPFSPTTIQNLAVIGPNANDNLNTMVGNSAGNPCKYVTPLQGLAEYVENTLYVAGCSETACDSADIAAASNAAAAADAIVVVVGLALEQEREALDRADLLLPGQQRELIAAVADSAAGRPVVLVVMSGGCVDISFAQEDPRIGAILWIGYPGQAGGDALAQIVFGEANPGGKLPSTWYRNELTACSMTTTDMRPNQCSGYPGRTYRFYTGQPIYEFGHGLSYTKFLHSFSTAPLPGPFVAPSAEQLLCGADGARSAKCAAIDVQFCKRLEFRVRVEVSILGESHGGSPGSDVVLLFVSPPGAGQDGVPLKQLVGFERVAVEPTGTVVEFAVNPCKQFAVSIVDENGRTGVALPGGLYTLSVNGGAKLDIEFV